MELTRGSTEEEEMEDIKVEEKRKVPEEVRHSSYGCPNCLWAGVECKQGSKYNEELKKGKKTCTTYTWYD